MCGGAKRSKLVPVFVPPRPRPPPLSFIKLLHSVIRRKAHTIEQDIRKLDSLAPDALVVDIVQRLEILETIVISHCRAEDEVIIPVLKDKAARRSAAFSSPSNSMSPPAKRQRSSPVSVSIESCAEDHTALAEQFQSLRKILKHSVPEGRTSPYSNSTIDEHRLNDNNRRTTSLPSAQVKAQAKSLVNAVVNHLDTEEQDLLPASDIYLNNFEQGPLLVKTLLFPRNNSHWPRSFEYMSANELVSLFEVVKQYASKDELTNIARMIYPFIAPGKWTQVCRAVPAFAEFNRYVLDPLTELKHIHTAIKKELLEFKPYCRNVDMSCKLQLHSLASRFDFVVRLYSKLLEGEHETLTLPMLETEFKLTSLESYSERSKELVESAEDLMKRLTSLLQNTQHLQTTDVVVSEAVNELESISKKLMENLDVRDKYLYSFIVNSFDFKQQESIVSRIMALLPSDIVNDLMPWMFSQLSIDEFEAMLRCLIRRANSSEFQSKVKSIAMSVQKGTSDACEWAELCSRLPEVRAEVKKLDSLITPERHGPVSEILRIHKAIRVDLNLLLRRVQQLPVDGTHLTTRTISPITAHVNFLQTMVDDHSKAEDTIVLPRLENRKPGSTTVFTSEHCNERALFEALRKCLEDLQGCTAENETTKLVWRLRVALRTLRDEMANHLTKEEEYLWPLVTTLFNRKEQSHIVALIFGNIPAERLQMLLPWMIRVLSVAERNEMMEHILQVTRSTMFEKWLNSWLPCGLEDKEFSRVGAGLSSLSGATTLVSQSSSGPGPSSAQIETETNDTTQRLRKNKYGCENIQEMVKAIAQDKNLDQATRAKLMQDVMLAPFIESQEKASNAERNQKSDSENLKPSFTTNKHGEQVYGCEHYQRGVKVRAACCGKFYACRLCHDATEKKHTMDRYATKEVMCMKCLTVQPVSNKCVREGCQQQFGKYFCKVCNLYNNDSDKQLYHCQYCNVCRVGEGLGASYFHCMRCNTDLHVRFRERHVCVENAALTDCPICYNYLFTSTAAVKYLQCGHLMHAACYETYSKKFFKCPVCSKSLEEMRPVYQRLDNWLANQQLPSAYSHLRCQIHCLDCNQRSTTQFRYLYLKCPRCNSFNTRKIE